MVIDNRKHCVFLFIMVYLNLHSILKRFKVIFRFLPSLFIIYGNVVFSSTIECQQNALSGGCIPSNRIDIYKTGNDSDAKRATVYVTGVNDSSLGIVTPKNFIPYDSITYIKNTDHDLNVYNDASSDRDGYNSGNTSIITSILDGLSMKSNGRNGLNGSDSSQLCAEAFKNGSLGPNASKYWEERTDTMPIDRCTKDDIDYADHSFSCPEGTKFSNISPVDTIELSKVIMKRQCSAKIDQMICVGRTADLYCNTNLMSEVCCDEPNKKWEDLGDYYNQPPIGSECYGTSSGVSNKCINRGPSNKSLSGDLSHYVFRIFEKAYLTANSDNETACENQLKKTPMKISWNVSYYDSFTSTTQTHPGNKKVIEREEVGNNFYDIPDTNHFTIPVIDNVVSVNDDNLNSDYRRYYIEGIVQDTNNDVNRSITQGDQSIPSAPSDPNATCLYGPKSPRCGNRIMGCLGLNGSDNGSLTCTRTPGPPFWVKIGLVDKYGAKSNPLLLRIPEGRFGFKKVFNYDYGDATIKDNSVFCQPPYTIASKNFLGVTFCVIGQINLLTGATGLLGNPFPNQMCFLASTSPASLPQHTWGQITRGRTSVDYYDGNIPSCRYHTNNSYTRQPNEYSPSFTFYSSSWSQDGGYHQNQSSVPLVNGGVLNITYFKINTPPDNDPGVINLSPFSYYDLGTGSIKSIQLPTNIDADDYPGTYNNTSVKFGRYYY